MPMVFVGLAVFSTYRQQLTVNAWVVRDQQHREEIVSRDKDHFEAMLFWVIFQPLETWHETGITVMGLCEKICGDGATGFFSQIGDGIAGFDKDEFADVGRSPFFSCSSETLCASTWQMPTCDTAILFLMMYMGIAPFDWA
jgi:hypothetical protein